MVKAVCLTFASLMLTDNATLPNRLVLVNVRRNLGIRRDADAPL